MTGAEAYRAEWATLTGRPEREVYVPEALREWTSEPGARVWAYELGERIHGSITDVLKTGTVRVKWDDGSISHEGVGENGRCQ